MSYDEMICVLQAAKEGKQIQCCPRTTGHWLDISEPTWDFAHVDYRVRPEPKVIYVNEYGMCCHGWNDKAIASDKVMSGCIRTAVKYIEAVDQEGSST